MNEPEHDEPPIDTLANATALLERAQFTLLRQVGSYQTWRTANGTQVTFMCDGGLVSGASLADIKRAIEKSQTLQHDSRREAADKANAAPNLQVAVAAPAVAAPDKAPDVAAPDKNTLATRNLYAFMFLPQRGESPMLTRLRQADLSTWDESMQQAYKIACTHRPTTADKPPTADKASKLRRRRDSTGAWIVEIADSKDDNYARDQRRKRHYDPDLWTWVAFGDPVVGNWPLPRWERLRKTRLQLAPAAAAAPAAAPAPAPAAPDPPVVPDPVPDPPAVPVAPDPVPDPVPAYAPAPWIQRWTAHQRTESHVPVAPAPDPVAPSVPLPTVPYRALVLPDGSIFLLFADNTHTIIPADRVTVWDKP